MNLAEVYQRANGRPPTNEDLARIVKIANALDVAGQDTFLCLLVAFDHYHSLYKEIPNEIAERVEALAESAQELVKTDIERLQATAQSEVAKAVQRAAEKSAAAAGVRAVVIWIAGAIVVSTLAVLGISSWLGVRAYDAGYAAGTVEMTRRDGFATTETFKKAMKLHEKGLLNDILMCKHKGWKVDGGNCFPGSFTDENGKIATNGWPIP